MALPNEFAEYESFSKEQWMEVASSTDPIRRKVVANCLRELGVAPADYMGWDAATRVDFIMSKAEPKKADTGSGKTSGKGKAAATPSASAAPAAAVGGIDPAVIAELQEKVEYNSKLLTKVHDLLVVLIYSNPAAKANAEELDVDVNLLGNG
jgi:hypothetical protein